MKDIRTMVMEIAARTKALETVLMNQIPKEKRDDLFFELDSLTAEILQGYLEYVEDSDPSLAARLDDRDPDDV